MRMYPSRKKIFWEFLPRRSPPSSMTEDEVILEALAHPIGSPRLREIVKPGNTVCIVISDVTRAWQRMSVYLPHIVKELNDAGIEDKEIRFLSALGYHRKHTPEEHAKLLGPELLKRFQIIDHDCLDKGQPGPPGHNQPRHAGNHQSGCS